jgi:outer membrane protein TolC
MAIFPRTRQFGHLPTTLLVVTSIAFGPGSASTWAATPTPVVRAVVAVQPPPAEDVASPAGAPVMQGVIPSQQSLLADQFAPIDLPAAVRLAGVRNPDLFLARQRVVEAAALRQLAAAQLLPNLNAGSNFDSHSGSLQETPGDILRVNRSSLYVGAGANAVGSGTVNIPGVVWNVNVSNTIYGILVARQVLREQEFANRQTNNDVLGAVGNAYYELMRAEGLRAVYAQIRNDTAVVADITAAFAKVGEGRQADAERAATELAQRQVDVFGAEGRILVASARLCQILNLDPSLRLHVTDGWVVPTPIVPEPIPLNELVAMAMLQRPDLAQRRAAIRETFLSLQASRMLPFSPNVFIGFSAGTFGGGSNIISETTAAPRFGSFSGRNDFDAIGYWTLQNLGYGNVALIDAARARLGQNDYQFLIVLNQARADVAESYALSMARYAQIGTNEQATRSGQAGFQEDLLRTRNGQGLPIETLNNLRLWARARIDYLNSIVDFNEAQVRLYVALGQPRADMLARIAPTPPGPAAEAVVPGAAEPLPPGRAAPQP